MSNCKIMLVFELSGSISLQMADFLLFFGAKFCEVPFVILLPWQQLKMYWLCTAMATAQIVLANELALLAKSVLKVYL